MLHIFKTVNNGQCILVAIARIFYFHNHIQKHSNIMWLERPYNGAH